MSSSPAFSVVMPTRNRPHLLRLSLGSALELRGDDFEVIVSDNCSTPETRQVVDDFGDRRVRYVRTPELIPISENLEFGLARSRGEYVTFLCDDDAFPAGMLDAARRFLKTGGVELLAWPVCAYFYPDWYDVRYRNTLMISPYSGEVAEVPASRTLNALARDFELRGMPRLFNVLVRRDLIERAKRRVPRLYPNMPTPEVFAHIVLLVEAGRMTWVDVPYTLWGRCAEGLGSSLSVRRGKAWSEYAREFPEESTFRRVPFFAPTETNMCAGALLMAKEKLGGDMSGIDLSWSGYFVRSFQDLMILRLQGSDVSEDLAALQAALAQQPDSVRGLAMGRIQELDAVYRGSLRSMARRCVNKIPVLRWLESVVRPVDSSAAEGLVLRGRQAGFTNLFECARTLDRVLSRPRGTVESVELASGTP